MRPGALVKRFRRLVVYQGAALAARLARLLPFALLYRLATPLSRLAWLLLCRQRRRTLEHLRLAYGAEKDETERSALGRGVFLHLARAAVEALHAGTLLAPGGCRMRIAGLEAAQELRDAGAPVLLAAAHFGNWELLLGVCRRQRLPVLAVARELIHPSLDRQARELREASGAGVLYTRGADTLKMARALRRGEWLGVLVDQNTKAAGIEVPFFGRLAHTPTGALELALRSRAAIVPAFLWRVGYRSFEVKFHPPLEIAEGSDEERLVDATRKLTGVIEAQVRRHPEQWVWMHRRWKDRRGRRKYQRFKTGQGGET